MDRDDTPFTELEDRLIAERPVPRAGYRAELRRRLLAGETRAPERARSLILACATSGTALLLVAAIGVAGAGPLAA